MQRTVNFTGIQGVNVQDRAVQESMGAICDRTKEHLGTTDRAIIMARRILLQAARTVEDGGDPPGLGTDIYGLRAIEKILPIDVHWRDAPPRGALQPAPLQPGVHPGVASPHTWPGCGRSQCRTMISFS